jgi:hypothetical protein
MSDLTPEYLAGIRSAAECMHEDGVVRTEIPPGEPVQARTVIRGEWTEVQT